MDAETWARARAGAAAGTGGFGGTRRPGAGGRRVWYTTGGDDVDLGGFDFGDIGGVGGFGDIDIEDLLGGMFRERTRGGSVSGADQGFDRVRSHPVELTVGDGECDHVLGLDRDHSRLAIDGGDRANGALYGGLERRGCGRRGSGAGGLGRGALGGDDRHQPITTDGKNSQCPEGMPVRIRGYPEQHLAILPEASARVWRGPSDSYRK